ncbi:MAG: hypothetical protein ACNS62_25095 [Candidatus Cyclobacteriaceae bacterium M3_2C_046]
MRNKIVTDCIIKDILPSSIFCPVGLDQLFLKQLSKCRYLIKKSRQIKPRKKKFPIPAVAFKLEANLACHTKVPAFSAGTSQLYCFIGCAGILAELIGNTNK